MANKRREYILHQVSKPDSILRLTICTISFGTGINKPYIELVVHWGAYGSVMDYRQEEDRTDREQTEIVEHPRPCVIRVKIILCQSLRQIWLLIWWPFRRPTNSQKCFFQYTCTRKKFILWKHSFIFQRLYIFSSLACHFSGFLTTLCLKFSNPEWKLPPLSSNKPLFWFSLSKFLKFSERITCCWDFGIVTLD